MNRDFVVIYIAVANWIREIWAEYKWSMTKTSVIFTMSDMLCSIKPVNAISMRDVNLARDYKTV